METPTAPRAFRSITGQQRWVRLRRTLGPPRRDRILAVWTFAPTIISTLFFVVSLRYISQTLLGIRPLPPIPTDSWGYCELRLVELELEDHALASHVWKQSLHEELFPSSTVAAQGPITDPRELYSCKCQVPSVYSGPQPKVTAVVQSFNHRGNIANISEGLKAASAVEEIVICEDGSTDGSVTEWQKALPGPSHFIIRSNNLHELRSYNRAMRLSAGDLVVLLQDDDLLPAHDEWIQTALQIFETKPNLGVLGGYIGQLWDPETGQGSEFGEQVSTHGGLRRGATKPIPLVDPDLNIPFMYAECVWIAPVFIRRTLLRKAGGLELTLAKRGEPGMWQDCILSYEAWVNGFTVGIYHAEFERGVGGHGSAANKNKIKMRELVWERAVAYTNRKFYRRRIHDFVLDLNNRTLIHRSAATVP